MQHVSANKWPKAARIKTKNDIGLHSVNFRVCSAFVPGISAFVFGAIVLKMEFTHQHGCKAMPQVAQGL